MPTKCNKLIVAVWCSINNNLHF